ncbi:MAG: DUF86 domain-containing protein [Deltaproteobacteria bacterium]|nr:DUF86 domain-containing protein [Deltaproteobacteria bacterium]
MGELANKLSKFFLLNTTEQIPWKQIISMRNRFVHVYETMDDMVIWRTAIEDIPNLYKFCEKFLEPEEFPPPPSPRFRP